SIPNGVICAGAVDGSNQVGAIVTCHATTASPAGAAWAVTSRVIPTIGRDATSSAKMTGGVAGRDVRRGRIGRVSLAWALHSFDAQSIRSKAMMRQGGSIAPGPVMPAGAPGSREFSRLRGQGR